MCVCAAVLFDPFFPSSFRLACSCPALAVLCGDGCKLPLSTLLLVATTDRKGGKETMD